MLLVLQLVQPKFCSNVSWDPNATNLKTNVKSGFPLSLTINRQNTIFAASHDDKRVSIWFNGSQNVTKTINFTIGNPISLFPINDQEILVAYDIGYPYIDRWSLKNESLLSSTTIYGQCYFLFVDINDKIYCSASNIHVVTRKSWDDQSNTITVVAGTGSAGSSSAMLNTPRGIYVTASLDLYVTDCNNDRVQFFLAGQTNATTIAGNGSNSIYALDCPNGVTLDEDGVLYIADWGYHRVIAVGSSSQRCIVGCTNNNGTASHQLSSPWTVAFDADGNLFVADDGNNRIQKFELFRNECCK